MHVSSQRLAALLILCAGLALSAPPALAQEGEPIDDPIPEQPIQSGLGLPLKEFTRLPKSQTTRAADRPAAHPLARINYLGEVPDGSGRLYVPDLNGKLYLIEHGDAARVPRRRRDVRARTSSPAAASARASASSRSTRTSSATAGSTPSTPSWPRCADASRRT